MKLGLSYNVFDGEELLRSSILSVRENCDYINVVYQRVSYAGTPCSVELEGLLSSLHRDGLVDQLYLFEPDLRMAASHNEIAKRNVGLRLARANRCSHFLSIDADEFYEPTQFKKAKECLVADNIEISACRFVNYIKEPIYQLDGLSFYCVPFISKIKCFSKLREANKYPVTVDPTRRMSGRRFRYFEPSDLVMHHMTYVRKDLEKKFLNSSGRDTFIKADVARKLKEWRYPDDWVDPTIHFVDPTANNAFKVNRVPNKFKIEFQVDAKL